MSRSDSSAWIAVTTIQDPTTHIQDWVRTCGPDWRMVVAGDETSPPGWTSPGVTYLSLADQYDAFPRLADSVPHRHYARKNLAYAHAIVSGATRIYETDDDNRPVTNFLEGADRTVDGLSLSTPGWLNVYSLFSDGFIWPRGFPLEDLRTSDRRADEATRLSSLCQIQQFLVDGDPDVDAIFRLVFGGEDTVFKSGLAVILEADQVCPFNSQNTLWWAEAFPLMYLPGYAPFRMTDIWRSLVAQACLHAAGGRVAFRGSTVVQERNPHRLLSDFEDEVPGYLHNNRVWQELSNLSLDVSWAGLPENLLRCYRRLIEIDLIPAEEEQPLKEWLSVWS